MYLPTSLASAPCRLSNKHRKPTTYIITPNDGFVNMQNSGRIFFRCEIFV
ncbi:MAG: hypothetical protein IJ492_05025 [Clostridia bacterium]|nr:hypothetical protein [Clostridia bacterium]MBQ8505613.1 hypothetical protein [Clostridia bacterium]